MQQTTLGNRHVNLVLVLAADNGTRNLSLPIFWGQQTEREMLQIVASLFASLQFAEVSSFNPPLPPPLYPHIFSQMQEHSIAFLYFNVNHTIIFLHTCIGDRIKINNVLYKKTIFSLGIFVLVAQLYFNIYI